MKECLESTTANTGHLVFAAGPAVQVDDDIFRVRVVHSTSQGKKDKTGKAIVGVQEGCKRFSITHKSNGEVCFTVEAKGSKSVLPSVEIEGDVVHDVADDRMEDIGAEQDESADASVEEEEEEVLGDDLSGHTDVQVIAARMCF